MEIRDLHLARGGGEEKRDTERDRRERRERERERKEREGGEGALAASADALLTLAGGLGALRPPEEAPSV